MTWSVRRACLGLAVVALAPGNCSGLRCYVSKHDCFPTCADASEQILAERNKIDHCSFVGATGDDFEWSCNRTLEACPESVDCEIGLKKNEQDVEECDALETFCVEQFRKPQNSRNGKNPVWGFEEVIVRSCAASCVEKNQSDASGIGVSCCTTDLCNTAVSTAQPLLVVVTSLVAFLTLY